MSEKQNIIKNELTAANPCDLHMHTTHSDASRTVAQVIEYAAMIGLKYIGKYIEMAKRTEAGDGAQST